MTATTRQTRTQRVFLEAIRNVQGLKHGDHVISPEAQQIYKGLCHQLPVLIRRNGLCQALAFIEAKAAGNDSDRAKAYQRLRLYIASVLGMKPEQMLDTVAAGSMAEYRLWTMAVLSAWVYYKRFAESMLGVERGGTGGEDA